MHHKRRWHRSGLFAGYARVGTRFARVVRPLQAWMLAWNADRRFQVASSGQAVQAVQGPQPGGVTAVAPTGDALPVMNGATLQCDRGLAPSLLIVTPSTRAANVLDGKPILNVPGCGMCCSLSNPTVASATAAALGTLTPMPCTPATLRWDNGSSSQQSGGAQALQPESTLSCRWGGKISILASPY